MELRGRCGVKSLALSKAYKSAAEGSILRSLLHSIIPFTVRAGGQANRWFPHCELYGGHHCLSGHLFFSSDSPWSDELFIGYS